MIEWQPFGKKSIDFIFTPLESDARINILEGSVRSSKTVTMIPKWLNYIKNGPKGLLLMTGVSKDTIYDNVLIDLFDTTGSGAYTYNRQTGDLIIYGRKIKVVGAKDEGSEKYIRGKTLAGAYCDELSLMPESFFKQLLNRLSVKGAKLYATTNPDSPMHYLNKEYITDETKIKSGMVNIIHFELDDNPNLDDDYKTFIRNAYTGLWYKRMILGLWVMAEGAIYDMWTNENIYEKIQVGVESTCRRFISIDYGTTNPMVFLDIYDDGVNVWVKNEYYFDSRKSNTQKTDSQYADDLIKFIGDEYPETIILDPSAASFKAELRQRGLRITDADNGVNDGIRMVASLLAQRKLKVNKACNNLIEEIQGYVWDDKAIKRGEEKPLKTKDHACDAMRYFVKTKIKAYRLIS